MVAMVVRTFPRMTRQDLQQILPPFCSAPIANSGDIMLDNSVGFSDMGAMDHKDALGIARLLPINVRMH